MTSVDEPGSFTLGVHSTTGAPTRPTVTGAPPTPSATPTTTDEPSVTDTSSITDEHFTTITPSISRMTLNNAIHSVPTETISPKWHRAAHAVLSTNELLCNIITHLPLKDIVAATGICKAWRSAIAADSAVQQALFLKPVEVTEVLVETRLLLALDKSESIDIDKCTVVGQLHPFAEKFCSSIKFRAAQSHALPLPRGRWRGCHEEKVSIFGRDHLDGSWRDMFLTQPPCTRVHIEVYGLRHENYSSALRGPCSTYVEALGHSVSLENDSGVKLGELYDYIACRSDSRACRDHRFERPSPNMSSSRSMVPTALNAWSATAKSTGQNNYQTRPPLIVMPLESLPTTLLTEDHGRAFLIAMNAAEISTLHNREMTSLRTLETEKEKTTMPTNGGGKYLCEPHGSTHICLQGLECMKTARMQKVTARQSEIRERQTERSGQ